MTQTVLAATRSSLAAATHLGDLDAGAVETLLVLAGKIDQLADTADPKFDNVTIPTYLKFCESLGLTPAGRLRLGEKKEAPVGNLARLRSVSGASSTAAGH